VRASSAEPTTLLGARRHQQTAQSHPSELFPTPTPHNHNHNHTHKTKTGGKEFQGTLKPLSSIPASHPAKNFPIHCLWIKNKQINTTPSLHINNTPKPAATSQTQHQPHISGAPNSTNSTCLIQSTQRNFSSKIYELTKSTTRPSSTNFETQTST
jgi:hypothetical protein